jgi:threonine dehydrogenase-like Zn-dependent dehydrogenase
VLDVRPGDRVVIAPNLACGLCRYCRQGLPNQCQHFTTLGIYLDGGLAKYNVAPEKALFKISDRVPFDEIVFTELLSCVVGGTDKVRLQPGESVVVLGAGPVGLMFLLVFKAAGAGKVIVSDVAPFRLELARKLGADVVVNPRQHYLAEVVMDETGLGADVVVDGVGTLFLFGMNQQARPAVSQYDITRNELSVYGTFIGIHTFPPAIKMIESGALKPSAMITHRLPLARVHEGIEAARRGEAMKVVIKH